MFNPLVAHSKVALIFEEEDGIPTLYGDETKIGQILRNFISNALKYTDQGSVVVSASVLSSTMVAFSVKDTGMGIAEEYHEKVFQEFTQVKGPHQRSKLGTGLGLPLARRLCEVLGGYVELESAIGKGSTFRAMIPMVYSGHNEF